MTKWILLHAIALFLNIHAVFGQDVITLDLSSPTNPPEIILNEKGYWAETYNAMAEYRTIEFELFGFTHNLNGFGGPDVGGGMSYWDGFTYCTSGDTNDYGEMGSSDGWVANQWGCMAGGGIQTDENGNVSIGTNGKPLVSAGIPYLVAYWGYWIEENEGGNPCLQVNFTDNQLYRAVGIYINNHPWPYYGNIHGDGFAAGFTQEGDCFKLIIHGLNEQKEDVGITVEHTLAEFKNGALHQSPDWEWIDLSALGTVSGIYFTMYTTDSDPIYGPNTAVYFCLDKLQVRPVQETTAPTRPTGLQSTAHETNIELLWTASSGTVGVKGYNLYLNGVFKTFVTTTQYNFTDLRPYTQYVLEVEAVATDNTLSEKASTTVRTTDETPPSAPENLRGTTTRYTMTLSWDASTDNVAVAEYHIYLNGERQKRVYTTSYTLTGLDEATEYFVEVEARDAAGNRSERADITISTSEEKPNGIETVQRVYYHSSHQTLTVETAQNTRLDIYDATGAKVLSGRIIRGENSVNVSRLPKGIYLVRWENHTFKWIK
jgi:chitodextrinase